MRARPLTSLAVGACLLVGLTGCEKPTPGVTASSGSHSVHIESTTYCRDGQSAAKRDCVEHLDRVGLLDVEQGAPVLFDVDKSLAENGWILVLTDANARSQVLDEHHFSYTPDFSGGPVVRLEVRSLDRVADDATTTGVWKFQLLQS